MQDLKGIIMNEIFELSPILKEEIDAVPNVIKQLLDDIVQKDTLKIPQVKLRKNYLQGLQTVILTASGSSYHTVKAMAHNAELLYDIPTYAIHSKQLMNTRGILNKATLIIAVSKTGNDNDTVFAVKRALRNGAKVIGVTVKDSDLGALCKNYIEMSEECESLCEFQEEYIILSMLSLFIGSKKGIVPKLNTSLCVKLAQMLCGKLAFSNMSKSAINEAGSYITSFENTVFTGYSCDEALAKYIAQKFREYTNKPAFAVPIYEVEESCLELEKTLIVPIMSNAAHLPLLLPIINNIKKQCPDTLIFTTESIAQEGDIKDGILTVEDSIPLLNPIILSQALCNTVISNI